MQKITLYTLHIALYQGRNTEIADLVFRHYQQLGLAFLGKRFSVLHEHERSEVLHDVWINLASANNQKLWESIAHFKAYFYTSLSNKAIDKIRQKKKNNQISIDETLLHTLKVPVNDNESIEGVSLADISQKEGKLRGVGKYFFLRHQRFSAANQSLAQGSVHDDRSQTMSSDKKIPITSAHYDFISTVDHHLQRHWYIKNMDNSHRRWQLLAIEEMMKSKDEGKSLRTDPKVGGVLVDPKGNVLAVGHRGEIETPGHCEYHIFHLKLNGNPAPPGSTLYVTLEPCSERSPSKIPCADRAINAGVKTVYIGMIDPDERIEYNGIKKLKEAGIEVRYFDFDLVEKIRKANSVFIAEKKRRKQKN